jgi:hypothetical protein
MKRISELVTADAVPSSLIRFTHMMEATRSSRKSVLTRTIWPRIRHSSYMAKTLVFLLRTGSGHDAGWWVNMCVRWLGRLYLLLSGTVRYNALSNCDRSVKAIYMWCMNKFTSKSLQW